MRVPRNLCSRLVLPALVLCSCSRSPEQEGKKNSPEFLLGGIQVNEPSMEAWHSALLDHGFNTVSLTTYARQQLWSGADFDFRSALEETDLIAEIQAAERRGLRQVLIPRVALDHAAPGNRFLWHGMIHPLAVADLDLWFEKYAEFVLGWAEVAEREGVEVLGIGSELSSLASTTLVERLPNLEEYYLNQEKQQREAQRLLLAEKAAAAPVDRTQLHGSWGETLPDLETYLDARTAANASWARAVTGGGEIGSVNQRRELLEEKWRDLIAKVRSVYSGQLTYAANFDQFQDVGFWDALDLIGVNAYFPLRQDLQASSEELMPELREGWRRSLAAIVAMQKELQLDLPVLFTEIGYTRKRGTTIEPWAGSGFTAVGPRQSEPGGPPLTGAELVVWDQQQESPLERTLALRALRESVAESSFPLSGLLYWKLSTVASHREIEPFVLLIGTEQSDPLLAELTAFGSAFEGAFD